MASDKRESNKKSSGGRAGLPFEPKGGRQRAEKSEQDKESRNAKSAEKPAKEKSKSKAAKAEKEQAAVSPKAQARVEEIRAMRQRRAQKTLQNKQRPKSGSSDSEIPKDVSQRMLRRMAFFSGMPIALGVGIFFLSYYLLSHDIVAFAPVAVLLVTMGCFGLGVLGLTYGVLSASWDEEPGGLVGLKEFKLNFGRAVESWRAGKEAKS
ncbi:MAG: PAM68 family protein [Phormidesmis sp.]